MIPTDIDDVDDEGNTPLHWAVESGQAKIIDVLIGMGAKTNILNKLKMAPLHLACDINCVEAIEVREYTVPIGYSFKKVITFFGSKCTLKVKGRNLHFD